MEDDAERRGRHSHAERGNEFASFRDPAMKLPRIRLTVRWWIAGIAMLAITLSVTFRLVVPIARDALERAEGQRWAREDANHFPRGDGPAASGGKSRTQGSRPTASLTSSRLQLSTEVIGLPAGLLMLALLTAVLLLARRAFRHRPGERENT